MLRCRACKARFSERIGTPMFGSHLPEATAVAEMSHLAECVPCDLYFAIHPDDVRIGAAE